MREPIEVSEKLTLLVAGYAGGINIGDEAIIATVAKRLKEHYGFRVVIASGQPNLSKNYIGEEFEYIKADYPGNPLGFRETLGFVSAIQQCDAVFFAGGGLLQDVHSTNLMEYCSFLASIANVFNKYVFSIGLGAGPIKSELGARFARIFYQNNDFIFFRDDYSRSYISNHLNVQDDYVKVGYDSIIFNELGVSRDSPKEVKIIGFCFRHWKNFGANEISPIVREFVEKGYSALFMAYESKDIELFYVLKEEFGDSIRLSDETTMASTIESIRSLDGLVSMRLHANLFALLYDIKFVAMAYDKKLETVMAQLGYGMNVLPLDATVKQIISTLEVAPFRSDNQLKKIKNTHSANFDVLVEMMAEKKTKLSLVNKFKIVLFWGHRLLVLRTARKLVMSTGPTISTIVPKTIKKKVKDALGLKW